jgi:hypothetical protein
MLMSFMGSIGSLMSGSGLAEAMEVNYGPNAVTHIMTGKAIARAVRSHFLTEAALAVKIMRFAIEDKLDSNIVDQLREVYEGVVDGDYSVHDVLQSAVMHKFDRALADLKAELSVSSRTAKLWLLYMSHIETAKLFIRAERMGDWNLHLIAVTRMLNLFAATGHNQYAKCGRLYLQMMLELPDTNSWLFDQFSANGFHTVRRSDRKWAGLWTDLVIEQVMMRTIKGRGGLTHGRGMTESVRLMWIHSMHRCATVHQAMTCLTGLETTSSEQHVEMGKSRSSRDSKDLLKLVDWFDANEPFDRSDMRLRSLASGLTARDGDGINCDSAEEVGVSIMKGMDNVAVLDVVLKKANQVRTLLLLQKGITIDNKIAHFDATNLFNRLTILAERTGDMSSYFAYELTAVPTALFSHSMMRKANKSALAKCISKNTTPVENAAVAASYVLDGGALLHRVTWLKTGTYMDTAKHYVQYIANKYGNETVVIFDGYANGPSTKDHEHQRRSMKSVANVKLDASMSIHTNQQAFLANPVNKSQFITLLSHCLEAVGHRVWQAANDADTDIVRAALEMASSRRLTAVVADDTDILVLLVYHLKPEMADIFMVETKKGRSTYVSIRAVQTSIGRPSIQQLLVIHAITGCDTTSALFGHGKARAFKQITLSSKTLPLTDELLRSDATADDVASAGCRLLVELYGGKPSDTLNKLRYTMYMNMLATGTSRPQPERLPPSERAAYFHCLRAHLQILQWKNLVTDIDPRAWGWKLEDGTLQPIPTDIEPAPADVLNIIRCRCKLTSKNACGTSQCSCQKNGLSCVAACSDCHGKECQNVEKMVMSDSDDSDSHPEFELDVDWLTEEVVTTTHASADITWTREEVNMYDDNEDEMDFASESDDKMDYTNDVADLSDHISCDSDSARSFV